MNPLRIWSAPRVLVLALLVVPGCGSPPILQHPERFYVREPLINLYVFQREWPDGSRLRGSVEVTVEKVAWPESPGGAWGMAGLLAHEAAGDLRSALAARVAPREELKSAMDPANIPEVFREQKLAGGGTMTRIDFNRLGPLRLPIIYELPPEEAPFSSRLAATAMSAPAEAAMVWHKVLAPVLGLNPFGRFTPRGVDEREGRLELTLEHTTGAGDSVAYRYWLAPGDGLVRMAARLRDGSELTVNLAQ